jgi:hypothetical protein
MLGNYRVAAQLVASGVVLNSTELVRYDMSDIYIKMHHHHHHHHQAVTQIFVSAIQSSYILLHPMFPLFPRLPQ